MSMLRRISTMAALCFLALLVFSPTLYAQLSTRATITGTVTDSTGAVVQGATVTIIDTSTKVETKLQSNSDGVFVAPGLNVASYTVTFAKAGFKSYTVTGVALHPTETVAVNGVLSVGAATQTVTVQATSSNVETSTPEVSASIDAEQISSLPMNGRNYQGIAGLMPGVVNTSQGSALGTGGRSTNSALSINGLDTSRSFYVLDGIWNENSGNMQQTSVVPNPDSLEEVRVLQNNFSAQYSLMGSSVIIMQTKSGTSNFHATAWEFWRNNALNTRPYFTLVSAGIPSYKQNIFGYNLGGPIFIPHHYNANRQKTFFFWDQQFVILHQPSQNTSTVPTAQQKSGCFVSPTRDPANPATILTPLAVASSTCPAGYYQIAANKINTSSTAYLNTLYPAPNYTLAGFTTNYMNMKANTTNQRDDEIKIDHMISSKYHAFAEFFDEYQLFAQNTESPGTTPISGENAYTHNKMAQVSLTQTLTPNMVNTTNIGMNIFLLNLELAGITDISQVPGFSETFFYPTATYASRTPVVSFSNGFASQGIQAARPIPHAGDLDNTVTDNWSWLHGKHYFTSGITFVWNTKRQVSGQQTNGNLSFSGASSGLSAAQLTANPTLCSTTNTTWTGSNGVKASDQCKLENSLADMLQGYIGGFSQASQAPHGEIHAFSLSPYFEDQFKLNKNWTFTAGLRLYDMPLPHGLANTEYNWGAGVTPGNMYANPSYNPALAPVVNEFTGALPGLFAPAVYSNGVLKNDGTSTGLPVNFSNAHRWYFGPDAGFAWDVRGDGKTSLRGGFGMSYTRIFTNQDCSFNCIANPPAFANQNLSNLVFQPVLPGTTPTTWNIVAAGGTANTLSVQTLTAADYNIQASPVASWSLGIQHEFPGNFTASIVGAGSRIQHMVGTWNWNQAPHYINPTTHVSYDYNPLISINPANGNKGDNAAYYAPYQGYGNINVMSTQLHQEWNGLEMQIKHPMSKSLYFTAAYTWSHDTSNSVVDPYDLHRFHGNNGLNYPQSLAITVLVELPFFRNSHGIGNVILGGWRINDITTLRAGNSITPGISMPSGVGGLTNRPYVVPGVSTKGPRAWKNSVPVKKWFNEAAFVDPTLSVGGVSNATLYYGYYGNAQNGSIQGPGQEINNTSLFKQFHIRHNDVLEFRAEAFNTFNHTNPSNPNASIGGSSVNKISGASDPRILEMALRYKF